MAFYMKIVNDYLLFSGRIRRTAFVRRYVLTFLLMMFTAYVGKHFNVPIIVQMAYLFVIPEMSLVLRRSHDIGLNWPKTIAILTCMLVPMFKLFSFIFLAQMHGERRHNAYGAIPRK